MRLLISVATMALSLLTAPAFAASDQSAKEQVSGTVSTKPPAFVSERAARAHCPDEAVVWIDTKTGSPHFEGDPGYSSTKSGGYACLSEIAGSMAPFADSTAPFKALVDMFSKAWGASFCQAYKVPQVTESCWPVQKFTYLNGHILNITVLATCGDTIDHVIENAIKSTPRPPLPAALGNVQIPILLYQTRAGNGIPSCSLVANPDGH